MVPGLNISRLCNRKAVPECTVCKNSRNYLFLSIALSRSFEPLIRTFFITAMVFRRFIIASVIFNSLNQFPVIFSRKKFRFTSFHVLVDILHGILQMRLSAWIFGSFEFKAAGHNDCFAALYSRTMIISGSTAIGGPFWLPDKHSHRVESRTRRKENSRRTALAQQI